MMLQGQKSLSSVSLVKKHFPLKKKKNNVLESSSAGEPLLLNKKLSSLSKYFTLFPSPFVFYSAKKDIFLLQLLSSFPFYVFSLLREKDILLLHLFSFFSFSDFPLFHKKTYYTYKHIILSISKYFPPFLSPNAFLLPFSFVLLIR